MWLIDLILNLAGLLLWLKWLEGDMPSALMKARVSIVASLRRASPSRSRWFFLAALLGLLLVRGFFYWLLGSATNWTPQLNFGPILLYFRSDFVGRIFLYSFFSFGALLAVFYSSLLLLSILNASLEDDAVQQIIRLQLGWLDRWPMLVKLLLPWFVSLLLWGGLHPLFRKIGILPAAKSWLHVVTQGAIVGLGSFLVWRYVLMVMLLLYVLHSYIYFGQWPMWKFVESTGQRILRVLKWLPLRVGKIDLAPVVALVTVIIGSEYAGRGLVLLYQQVSK